MTETKREAPETSPLAYARSPRAPFNKRQFYAGLTASLTTCGVCFGMLFYAGAYYYEDDSTRPRLWAWLALGATLAVLALVTWLAARADRLRGQRGRFLGVLLGLGLSALPLGMCYYAVGATALGR